MGNADDCDGGLSASISGVSGDKDGLSTGNFFALGARLARYTGNATFGNWAENVFSWAETEGLVGSGGEVFTSFSSESGCKNVSINEVQWSADAGAFLLGAAHMFNFVSFPPPYLTLS